jgi:signal transduction histidine kinase
MSHFTVADRASPARGPQGGEQRGRSNTYGDGSSREAIDVSLSLRARAQRERRARRSEVLLDASHRITQLRPFADTLGVVAGEAWHVLGSGFGLCFATGADGRWIGAVASASGLRLATPDEVLAVETLVAGGEGPRVATLRREPVTIRLSLPPGEVAVIAPPDNHAATAVVLIAVGDQPVPGRASSLAATLAALGAPAALAIANARLYESLQTAYREQLDLNRQKEEFVSTVSHELRTPVAAITGTLSTVVRAGDRIDGAQRDELLRGASGYARRLTRIVEELLLVAAGDHDAVGATVDDVEVRSVLEDVVEATAAAAGGRVVAIASPALDVVRTDGDKLRTALVHLVENAAKYAPEGAIDLEAVAAGRQVLFYVTDHGPGIATADRERVFEPFVQLDQSLTRARGGMGIGLHLARQLATLLGGELVLTNAPGTGCCFCLAIAKDLAPRAPSFTI